METRNPAEWAVPTSAIDKAINRQTNEQSNKHWDVTMVGLQEEDPVDLDECSVEQISTDIPAEFPIMTYHLVSVTLDIPLMRPHRDFTIGSPNTSQMKPLQGKMFCIAQKSL